MGIATGTLLGPYRVADNNQWRVVRLIDRPHRLRLLAYGTPKLIFRELL